MSYIDCCDFSECTRCGECLEKCPVLQLDHKTAVEEISRLLEGKPTERVLQECTLCYRCNNYCPVEGLRPYELIMERVSTQKDRKESASCLATYMANGMPISLWSDNYRRLDAEEINILKKWYEPPEKSKEALWVGCVGRVLCKDIENSKALAELPKYGPVDCCCGELAYRMGEWDTYTQQIEKTYRRLEKLEIDRLVCYCGSCYYFLSNVLPKVYKKPLPFKLVSMYEWLLEKVKGGDIEVTNPIALKMAVQDSCYMSGIGGDFYDILRELYKSAGIDTVELAHNRDYGTTCGLASAARNYNLIDWVVNILKKHREMREVNMSDAVCNCPGCTIMLNMPVLKQLYGIKEYHHAPDLLLSAFGDEVITGSTRMHHLTYRNIVERLPLLLAQVKRPLPEIKEGKENYSLW